ncbi:MAG: HAMP domain-containing sensor histidine kinase [Breznakibacter sp.]
MEKFYAEDLDELIEYRSEEFIKVHLPGFSKENIGVWNGFNEDVLILPFDETYPLGMIRQKEYFNKAEGHNIDYRIMYRRIAIEGQPYILISRVPMIERGDLIATLCTQYGLLFVILLVSLSAVYYYMSKKLWHPFYNTLNIIENFNLEQAIVPEFKKTGILEFERLNKILTALLSNDIKIYNHQKKFIENASHELQTPLAIFLSQLDMLLQSPDLTESQTTTVQSLYTVAARMTRLNKNLLLLAKIDNAQFRQMEDIDFIKLLYTQLSYLRDMAENNGLTISIEIANDLKIRANKTLTESLVNNLIVNAIRHNKPDGTIRIEVKGNKLSVTNNGDETSLDTTKVFQRFSRTSEEKKGNGLGLSIVLQIAKLHKWELEYNFAEKQHCFTVNFSPLLNS